MRWRLPSVPTIGKAETASVPWVTVGGGGVVGGRVRPGPVIVTGMPLTSRDRSARE